MAVINPIIGNLLRCTIYAATSFSLFLRIVTSLIHEKRTKCDINVLFKNTPESYLVKFFILRSETCKINPLKNQYHVIFTMQLKAFNYTSLFAISRL